ncbi:MAG TPA: ABC transporter ATP-binding protein [Pseudomonadales bacterium]|nr:ABC transporter ATP-binding protein [Pseudomonadales bacterium]
MSEPAAISIRGLTKQYSNGFQALKGIDLEVKAGDFFALLGPNGAGKSTTIGIISSLVNKTSGSVSVFGTDIDVNFPKAKRDIGIVPQEFNFNIFEKPFDILVNQAGYYGMPRAEAVKNAELYLKELGLWEKRNVPSRTLSGGMKRRLMIARALIHKPRLLILDEPTAGVDIELRRSMWKFIQGINQQGTTIILTTHYLEEAEQLCKNIAIINHGEIVENTDMKSLLRRLKKEVFVLDSVNVLPQDIAVHGHRVNRVDDHTLEIEVDKGQSLNTIFSLLAESGVEIGSMRTRANRLEELFVELLDNANKEVSA